MDNLTLIWWWEIMAFDGRAEGPLQEWLEDLSCSSEYSFYSGCRVTR